MKGPIQKQFERLIELLEEKKARYALAGGYAASLYRRAERFTKDIDLLLWTYGNVIQDAHQILKALGLKTHEIREADLRGGPFHKRKSRETPVWMVSGRGDTKEDVPVDFLLHLFPWMLEALDRAELNRHDIGFGWKIPILTPEDVILAKFMALSDKPLRVDDLSDIKFIFEGTELDLPYLIGRMKQLKIACPDQAQKFVPKIVKLISREIALR